MLQSLADRIGPRVLRTPRRLDDAARWLDGYFAGAHDPFGLPLDTRLARGFRLEVLGHLQAVPYGERVSYAALAAQTSSPKAVRAVGTACATNPLPLVIPCHRVTRSRRDGRRLPRRPGDEGPPPRARGDRRPADLTAGTHLLHGPREEVVQTEAME